MPDLLVITHPEVVIDPATPIPEWGLCETGRRRADAFARSDTLAAVTHVWTSPERKARETAALLADPRNLPITVEPRLAENDRSATGYLPPAEFEAAADAFFAHPRTSYRGWERAFDAQKRIVDAIRDIVGEHTAGDLAIATHGAVGTLLWCALAGRPIDRRHDQSGPGHYWVADLATLEPRHEWRSID